MNKISQFVFILLALVLASAISLLTYRSLTKKPKAEKTSATQVTETLVVAAVDIARGSKIENESIRMEKFLKDSMPNGSFTTSEMVVGRIAKQPILASEPVLESRLVPPGTSKGGLAALVPDKKRAMAVKVDQVIGVAGFLDVDHMVDVLVSIKSGEEEGGYISKTVLENIKILSAGSIEEGKDKEKKKRVNVITLEVTPEEAEKLALAVTKGKILLALRGYADTDDALTSGATVTSLLQSYRADEQMFVETVAVSNEKPEIVQPPPAPIIRKKKGVAFVINGSKIRYIEGR